MSHSKLLDRISITSPCSQSWDEMRGNDQVRFCAHCDLSVRDLSQLTRFQAEMLVLRSRGRICLRIHRTPAGDMITRELNQAIYSITRRTSRIAASAFTAVISLSGAAMAQGVDEPSAQVFVHSQRSLASPKTEGSNHWLTGTIFDQNGAVIVGVKITVANARTGANQEITSDSEGVYGIWVDVSQEYQLTLEHPGFMTSTITNVVIDPNGDTKADVTMTVSEVLSGAVAVASPDYQQPLVKAASDGEVDEVKRLLEQGLNVNQAEEEGINALQVAIGQGNVELVRILLDAGGNVNAVTQAGTNAAYSLNGGSSPELVDLVLRAGVDVNQVTVTGDTLITVMAWTDDAPMIQVILAAGAAVNAQNQNGESGLMIAASNGNIETVRVLLAAGAAIGLRNNEGKDALTLAREAENNEIVELLRAAGAVDSVSENDREPAKFVCRIPLRNSAESTEQQ